MIVIRGFPLHWAERGLQMHSVGARLTMELMQDHLYYVGCAV
jgi:hypothetical protein